MNLLQSTQIMVNLSLNVTKNCDGDVTLRVFNILAITPFLFLIWQLGQFIAMGKSGLSLMLGDLLQAIVIIGKLLSIGFNSFAYGVGGAL